MGGAAQQEPGLQGSTNLGETRRIAVAVARSSGEGGIIHRDASDRGSGGGMNGGDFLQIPGRGACRVLAVDPEFALLADEGAREMLLTPRPRSGPASTAALRLRAHLELGQQLAVEGVARPLRLEPAGPVLVLEQAPGAPLSQILREGLPMARAAAIGLSLASVVARLHRAGIIHRGLRPDAFLVEGTAATLVDLGTASRARRGRGGTASELPRADLLPWIAPELTGRMSHGYDSRADLYALGAILYALFSGRAPFVETDPAALLHRHLAAHPAPLASLQADVPPALDAVVQRLLAKRPDDRYFTAQGLMVDLGKIAAGLAHGRAHDLTAGGEDHADWIRLPAQIYGREREREVLSTLLDRVAGGAAAAALITGPSGIGKSLLARDLRRSPALRGGRFVQGKFIDGQPDRDTVLVGLGELTSQALVGRDEEVAAFSAEVHAALGDGVAIVAEAIPEARALLGDPGPPAALPPVEARNRFRQAMRTYLGLFARPGRPLVLCLDDLQWAGAGELDLLERLMEAGGVPGLLLLFTARDDDASRPRVEAALQRIARPDVPLTRLALPPLDGDACAGLLADATSAPRAAVGGLAALLAERSSGNPLAFVETLLALHDDGLVTFDHAAAAWRFDLDEIRRRTIDRDLARVLGERVRRLADEARGVLQVAACLGNQGDLALLAAAADGALEAADAALAGAEAEGLVMRTVDRGAWSFVHDQVRQAVLDERGPRAELHAAIALRLSRHAGEGAAEQKAAIVARQAVGGLALLTAAPWPERLALARHLIVAGSVWRRTLAFDAASGALDAAVRLLGDEGWTRAYSETLAAHRALAEAETFADRRSHAEEVFAICLARATSALDRARIHEARVTLANVASDHETSLDAARAGLALVGVTLPREPSKARVALELARSRWLLGRRKPEDLLAAPEMVDEAARVALDILIYANAAAYQQSEELAGLVFLLATNLALLHGNSPASAYAFTLYGAVVASALRAPAAGLAFGRVGVRLADRYGDRLNMGRTRFVVGDLLNSWQEDWGKSRALIEEAIAHCSASGDFLYVTYANCQICLLGVIEARPFAAFAEWLREAQAYALRGGFHDMVPYCSGTLRYVDHLAGRTEGRRSWSTAAGSEQAYLTDVDRSSYTSGRHYVATLRVASHVLAGDPEEALVAAVEAEKLLHSARGQIVEMEYSFQRGLAAGDVLARAPNDKRAARSLKAAIEQFERWVRLVPQSFEGRLRLLEGLSARAAGDTEAARAKLLTALESARRRGELHVQGICAERLAALAVAAADGAAARRWILDAIAAYDAWGAAGKVAWLREDHAWLLGNEPAAAKAPPAADPLDLASVLKSAAALASEVHLDRLLERIMAILVENVGARRGALLVERDGDLRVEMAVDAEGDARALRGVPLAAEPAIAEGVVRYVARTGEAVVLDDAALDPRFSSDPRLADKSGMSVLCRALVAKGRQACIVYLENDLADGAFSADRLRVVELLSAQAAIALENAALYATLEEKVAARTAELSAKNAELGAALERLRATQEQLVAQEKLASLGALMSGIAHELRNPLNFVNNFAELSTGLVDELDEGLRAGGRDLADTFADLRTSTARIAEHGRRADNILGAMLQHARGAGGARADVDLNALVAELVHRILEAPHHRADIAVTLDEAYDPGVGTLSVVTHEIGRVLGNVVDNALWAMGQRRRAGEPAYRPTLTVRTRREDDRVLVVIRDNGIGIPADVLDRIYDPFFTTKPPGEGAGLGLSISHDIVRRHRGELSAASVPGEFTELVIALPA
jgi:predicted ATPase/signal transduction histidine kinase